MKKLILSLFVISQYCFAAGEQFDYRKTNQEVAEKLLATVGGCGERIWPGYDLKNLNIVLVDKATDDLLAVSFKEKKIFNIKRSALPASKINSVYSFFSIENQSWMSVNSESYNFGNPNPPILDEMISETFKLAVHEAFHEAMQNEWISREGSRGTFVPIKWEPRYYRAMIYKNLVEVYTESKSSQVALQKAKYWFDKWAKDYPEEVLSTTDGYEGSAQYSEVIASFFSNLSCNINDNQLSQKISEAMPNDVIGQRSVLSGYAFQLDGEGYELGALAALILRRDSESMDWHQRIAKGETPLEILLQNAEPKFQEVDEKFKEIFLGTQMKNQAKIDNLLSETYSALKEKDKVFLSVPRLWKSTGSTRYKGFFIDKALDVTFSIFAQDMTFVSPDKISKIDLKQQSAALSKTSPCDINSPFNFVMGTQDITVEDSNKISIHGKNLTGSLMGKPVKDKNGNSWFCAGETGLKSVL